MKSIVKNTGLLLGLLLTLGACNTIDVYEVTKKFPEHEWNSKERPSFTFDITDTMVDYNVSFVIRHEDAYDYNNIWVKMSMKGPADSVAVRREFVLGNNENGWLGSGMDDIFEHRIPFNSKPATLAKGKYTFTLQQDMREDPLKHVLAVGIRVEKAR